MDDCVIALLQHFADVARGKAPLAAARSGKWPALRAAHLRKEPLCRVCGGAEKLEAHHIKPFHLHPELELEPSNLMTLCEAKRNGLNCHQLIGHLGDFHSWNEDARSDAMNWQLKLTERPR